MEEANTSGHGNAAIIPQEISGWNWGAFLLNWVWGIGNDTYIALLMLLPPSWVVMPFVLGAKGNEWAWRNRSWENVAHFKRVQRNWARAGFIVWIATGVFVAVLFAGVFITLKNSEVYKMAVTTLRSHPAAISALGEPISTDTPYGEISVSGYKGKADLSFSVSGPKSKGQVVVGATKNYDWKLDRLELQPEGGGAPINLLATGL